MCSCKYQFTDKQLKNTEAYGIEKVFDLIFKI